MMQRTCDQTGAAAMRPGITLLEVLISCGLLVIGLTAMAAMLPAAGSRLAQAGIEDRASVVSSNALAELKNRGMLSAAIFPTPMKAVAFGRVMEWLPDLSDSLVQGSAWFASPTADAVLRCGSPRTFLLEDDLLYDSNVVDSTPVNAFHGAEDGVLGARKHRGTIGWGATLIPKIYPAVSGGAATLSVPIFKRDRGPGGMQPLVLTRTYGYYEADVISPGSLLRACSWVLAIPADSDGSPAWFKVNASWVLEPPATQVPRVVLRDQDDFAALTDTGSAGQQATVIAFEELVRVDEHHVVLE